MRILLNFKKQTQCLTAFFVFYLLVQNCQAQEPASNLISNGGAENGSDKVVAGWTFVAGNVAVEDVTAGVATQAIEGKQSFQLSMLKPVQANVWWVQEISLTPGTKSLQISCRTKSKVDAARTQYAVPAVSCYFLDGANQWMQWQSVQNVPESADWVTLKRNVAVPVGAARMGIRLGVQSQGVIDTFFDDVSVIPSSGAYLDAVANGDLEDSTDTTLGWTFQKKLGTDTQLAFGLSSDAAKGKQALRIAAPEANAEVHGYWGQAIPVVPGLANYQLSLRGKLGAATGAKQADATVGYAFLDDKMRQLGYQAFGLLTDKTWGNYSTVVSPPPDAKYIEIRLGLDGVGQTEALFDDIKMVPSL